ncbi:hypothetical protein GCAAIG_09635 [Candidatus Electronema halotolerans]
MMPSTPFVHCVESRMPSPVRLKAKAVSMMAMPG